MKKEQKSDVNVLRRRLKRLQRKNDSLKDELEQLTVKNRDLSDKLSAKRYKAVDLFVDSFYKVARKAKHPRGMPSSKNSLPLDFNTDTDFSFVPGKVDIINLAFYDWDGKVVYKGGAERYVYDLACLLKNLGYTPRILQCSNMPFEKTFKGIKVIGIGKGDRSNMVKTSRIYNSLCSDCEFVIASPLELASAITNIPVVGINHGIGFDGDWNHYNKKTGLVEHDDCMAALTNVDACVCVDTNFINWVRTVDYELALKGRYIPNYFDSSQFKSADKSKRATNRVVFVYPRRIYSARGYDITISAFDEILKTYKDRVELRFVGQIDNDEVSQRLTAFMQKYPKTVSYVEYDMEDMHKAYDGADVVLVPTRFCEGTSLSCVEAMASGVAVIATNVGGLPNLIIDGYNGRLISPTAKDLRGAAIELIENSELRKMFARNAKAVANAAFNKENWETRWKSVINDVHEQTL